MTRIFCFLVLSLWLAAPATAQMEITVVDAAAFQGRASPGMLASGFSGAIPNVTEVAEALPLPTELAGFSLEIVDSAGQSRSAELIGVFSGQINFVIPDETALGISMLRLQQGGQTVADGEILLTSVAPGIFTANASGEGVPAGFVLFSSAAGTRTENLFVFDANAGMFQPRAIDMSNPDEEVRLLLFGTGIRGRTSLENIVAQINGVPVGAEFAGDQGQFRGLDQLNLGPLPRVLDDVGSVGISLLFDAVAANIVDIAIGEVTPPPSAPSLTSVTPDEGVAGATVAVELAGMDLADVSSLSVSPPDGITVSGLTASATSVRAALTIAAGAAAGTRMLRVTAATGSSNSLPFTVTAAAGLQISNLTLDATASAPGGNNVVVFSGGFDFEAPDGNIFFSGEFTSSAHIELVLSSEATAQRCTFLMAGSPLNFPGQTSGMFRLGAVPPFPQDDIAPGMGMVAVTLVAPDGERSNTLEKEARGVPLCDPADPPQVLVFP